MTAIGSGVVEAANKTLLTQHGAPITWRIVGGQAVLTFRALIKSEREWTGPDQFATTPANDNDQFHVQQPWQSP